jgi:hypothetical protein
MTCPRCRKDNLAPVHTCTPLAVRLADLLDQFNNPFEKQVATELLRLSTQADKDEALLRQALDCLENHVMQRTYAGGVVISNTAIALRERLKETT